LRVGIVVEGATDKEFFKHLAPWFAARGVDASVTTAKDKGRLRRDAQKHIETHRINGRELVILVTDQDDDECPAETAATLPGQVGVLEFGDVAAEPAEGIRRPGDDVRHRRFVFEHHDRL